MAAFLGLSLVSEDQLDTFSQTERYSDRELWQSCIHDIQNSIIDRLSDVLQVEKMKDNSPPILLIDPAYGINVGDNLIAYGELVLMERLGFSNHTECNIIQSQGFSRNCDNFTHLPDGGLAWWHGGGNWGDLWARVGLQLRSATE